MGRGYLKNIFEETDDVLVNLCHRQVFNFTLKSLDYQTRDPFHLCRIKIVMACLRLQTTYKGYHQDPNAELLYDVKSPHIVLLKL